MHDTTDLDTAAVLDLARLYLDEHGLKHLVVASTKGTTGIPATETFDLATINLIVVTHAAGFRAPNEQEFPDEVRAKLKEAGARVLTASMPFHSWNDHYRKNGGTVLPTTIVADTLRMFGQGTKVCVEIVCMAADAGLIPAAEPVLAIAGTGYGADTVLMIKSANSRYMMDLKVLDVVAKPRSL